MAWRIIDRQDLIEIVGKYYITKDETENDYKKYYNNIELLDSKDEQTKFIIKYLSNITSIGDMLRYTKDGVKPILSLFTEIDESIVDVIISNNLSDKLLWPIMFWYIDRVCETNDISRLNEILKLVNTVKTADTKYIDLAYSNNEPDNNFTNRNAIIAMLKIAEAVYKNTGTKSRISFKATRDIEYLLSMSVNEGIDFKTIMLFKNYSNFIISSGGTLRTKKDLISSAFEITIQDFLASKDNRLNFLKYCIWNDDWFKKFYDQYEDEVNDILIQDLLHFKGFSFKEMIKLINKVFNTSDCDVNNIFLSERLPDETKSKILLITMSD